MLVEYIRGKNNSLGQNIKGGQLIGVVVALDKWSIGWSLCSKKDKFNKQRALEIAIGRAEKSTAVVPTSIKPVFVKMINRAMRYFK